jgi:signal peptidase II
MHVARAVRIRPSLTQRTVAGRLGIPPIALACMWLACLLTIVVLMSHAQSRGTALSRIALGAALGGAAANLFDVLVRKAVVDYIELGPWPAFNLADVAIVAGVIGAFVPR